MTSPAVAEPGPRRRALAGGSRSAARVPAQHEAALEGAAGSRHHGRSGRRLAGASADRLPGVVARVACVMTVDAIGGWQGVAIGIVVGVAAAVVATVLLGLVTALARSSA